MRGALSAPRTVALGYGVGVGVGRGRCQMSVTFSSWRKRWLLPSTTTTWPVSGRLTRAVAGAVTLSTTR